MVQLVTVAVVYLTQGESGRYLDHAQNSYDLYRQAFGESHPKVARAIYYLAMARFSNGGLVEDSEKFLREGVAIMRQTESTNVNLPYMLQTLAGWLASDKRKVRTQAHFDEAEAMNEEARGLFAAVYGEDSRITIGCDYSLADIAIKRGDLDRAERILKGYQQRVASPSVEGHVYGYIWSFYYLGEIERLRGKRSEAQASYDHALELGRKKWSEDSKDYGKLLKWISEARVHLTSVK